MKKLSKLAILSSLLIATIWSCKKDETKNYYEGGTPPALTSTSTALTLSDATKNDVAFSLSWTNSNYQFTTGASSFDVSYLIEIDTVGANFTNPQRQSIAVNKNLNTSFTVGQFNGYLLNQLQLDTSMTHNLEVRVTARLLNGAVPLASNSIRITAKPYPLPPAVTPPVTGKLFLVGGATPGGWNNPVPVPSQQFTKVSNTLYEITIPLKGGEEYLLLPLNGDWGNKYAVDNKTIPGLSAGGDFGFNKGDNFPAPAADGNYKISVDFQRGKFTLTKL